MNNSFQLKPLSEIIDFKNGKAIKTSNGNIPIYGGNGILGYTNDSNYVNNLIIGRVGAYCGSVHLSIGKCWVSDNAIAGEAKENTNLLFAYYLLKSLNLNQKQVGSSQPLLTQGILNHIYVHIPEDKTTQQKIALVLSTLDEKIALNNQINATLEQMAKTLYDYWFVQFDFPDENGKPYKSSGGEMVYNETLKRDIPKGWESSNILKVADLLGGGTPRKDNPDFWNGNIPFFTPTDCDNSVFVLKTSDNITDLGLSKSSTKLFKENTIFITARGSVGRMSLNAVPMAMNQSCYALQPKEKSDYSYLFFLTKELVHNLEVKAVGSVFDSIVSNDIEQTFLAIPPNETIKLFIEKAEPIFQKIKLTSSENNQLTKLRDWLLPMLMNGQVTVQ